MGEVREGEKWVGVKGERVGDVRRGSEGHMGYVKRGRGVCCECGVGDEGWWTPKCKVKTYTKHCIEIFKNTM